jgi:hypothetical protein
MRRAEKLRREHAALLKKYDTEEGIKRHFKMVARNKLRDAEIAKARAKSGVTRQEERRRLRILSKRMRSKQ